MKKILSGAEIRQSFIDFFMEHQHTFVPSASLVPGGDATLLFTNAGMVQFKDVFLGTDKRPYARAVNSQKCMRVAGKHNDLDDVGRDDFHHTFFEMLGNWSFGDYYKKEAIAWAWQLLTDVWGLPKDRLYATCFKDDKGSIPTDEEAAKIWKQQPGIDPAHILFFGRKDNLWEMADTGPCGPCSEIHFDRGEEYDDLAGKPHMCGVNGECKRYLELWNNVFIQYNRVNAETLEPLPTMHVDTGMGFERIVAVLQGVDSNYKIDLFSGVMDVLRALTGDSAEEMNANFTPYRVIADHVRAASFLIADGVVPGNMGRNYICRMIIRRAARFGSTLELNEPFLAKASEAILSAYGDFYPELVKHRKSILDNLTREEVRFARTIESGTAFLQGLLDEVKQQRGSILGGERLFELYATYGLPLEIARDIAREQGLDVDEPGFRAAMDEHRLASGGGKAMGAMGGEDTEFYAGIVSELKLAGKLGEDGVANDPYNPAPVEGQVLSLVVDGSQVQEASAGDRVEILLPATGFYIESGGQVSDTGVIRSAEHDPSGEATWEIDVADLRRPSAGAIVHAGEVVFGHPKTGDRAIAIVDHLRRHDIMRNHTATHLLHTALHQVLGETARQAGSLVAEDHLRFDFNHPDALTSDQLERVEELVNQAIAADHTVIPAIQDRETAIAAGAMALFGEKYGERVRTITIGHDQDAPATAGQSFELCGGTHLDRTSDVGIFLILNEGSVAAGIRRIEAVTGRGAYQHIAQRFKAMKKMAGSLKTSIDNLPEQVVSLQSELAVVRKQAGALRVELAQVEFDRKLGAQEVVSGVNLLVLDIPGLDKETLTILADRYRDLYPEKSICVIGSTVGEQAVIMAAVSKELIKKNIKAGDLVGFVSRQLGAGGGGAPHLAFGGGKNIAGLPGALASVRQWVEEKLS